MHPSIEAHLPGLIQAVWVLPRFCQLLCHLLSHPTTDEPQGIHRRQGPASCSGHSSLPPPSLNAGLTMVHSLESLSLSCLLPISAAQSVSSQNTALSGLPSPGQRLPSQSWNCSYPDWQANALVGQGHHRTAGPKPWYCFLILAHRGWEPKTKGPTRLVSPEACKMAIPPVLFIACVLCTQP